MNESQPLKTKPLYLTLQQSMIDGPIASLSYIPET
jgi:hypothetical protein